MSTFTRTTNSNSNPTSNSTDAKNGTMNATMNAATTEAKSDAIRRPRLSGMTWLVWRQHRAAFWTVLAAAALSVAWMVYQRGRMTDFLDGYGYPGKEISEAGGDFQQYIDAFSFVSTGLSAIPILLGVFLGAPLLAGDLENGTAKLIAAQSMSRNRWLATKLALAALVVVVSTGTLSAVFGWWWNPVKSEATVMDWTTTGFDLTGPVPVALTLLSVIGGAAIGVVLRRTLMSMVVTFGFTVVLQLVWSYVRLSLGDIVTVTTNKGVLAENSYPVLPDNAFDLDQSYITSSGDLIGWSSCSDMGEKAQQACLTKEGVVGWSVDYLPISQMNAMQWFGASILFALTAGVVAFLFFWGRKRLV
ncbi:ABC transporter permease subunit [Streptomyces sp. NBC_01390]|uniref:ABC transporter n=1 Tax=Streptomyces sp. NBC_01390 TaxID=2903850 RepID=UPI003245C6B7